MRHVLPVVAALAATLAPAASACTIDNCAEVRLAHVSSPAGDAHGVAAECLVTGRGGTRFAVTAWTLASGHDVARTVTLRCTAYIGTTVVFDSTLPNAGPAAAFTGGFLAGSNVRACVTTTATWADGHSRTASDCS